MQFKRFDKFAGVDYSADKTQIGDARSPDALNIMPDSGGLPEKRVGWRTIEEFEDKINGIFTINDRTIVHAGDKMYRLTDDEPEVLMSGVNNAKSFGIVFGEKLWILTGEEYLCYPFDGEMVHVRDIATVPQVLSQATPSLTNGISYQPFNLLTSKRKIGIKIPSGQTVSELTIKQLIKLGGSDYLSPQIKVYDPVTGASMKKKTEVLDDTTNGYYGAKITLKESYKTKNAGDDIMLEYELEDEHFDFDTGDGIEKNAEKIKKNREIIEHCTFGAIYENRLFLSGNPDYPNTDFYCELNDPTYFADVNYTGIGTADEAVNETEADERKKNFIGTGGTKIMGYSYVGGYLAIHKDGNDTGASLYLRSATMTDEGMIFPVKEGIVGESIVSPHSCATFIDDPVFLTKSGVYAVARADVTSERSLQSRSTRVNNKLTNEKNLENAVTCVHNGYLMLFVNGNVYVADSRQKSYARNISNAFEYEWYFWDSVPARVAHAVGDTVYFGTEDGKLCRFNNDMKDGRGGYKMCAYNDDGAPICARWSTKMEDVGDFSRSKILRRRGGGVYVKAYEAGDITLSVRTERDFGRINTEKKIGVFNFKDLNFENFTFNTLPVAFVPFTHKVKDCRMLQIIVENNKVNQCMGVVAIRWNYTSGGIAK